MASNGKVVDDGALPKKEGMLDFVWNSENRTFLGRTGGSWGKSF